MQCQLKARLVNHINEPVAVLVLAGVVVNEQHGSSKRHRSSPKSDLCLSQKIGKRKTNLGTPPSVSGGLNWLVCVPVGLRLFLLLRPSQSVFVRFSQSPPVWASAGCLRQSASGRLRQTPSASDRHVQPLSVSAQRFQSPSACVLRVSANVRRCMRAPGSVCECLRICLFAFDG